MAKKKSESPAATSAASAKPAAKNAPAKPKNEPVKHESARKEPAVAKKEPALAKKEPAKKPAASAQPQMIDTNRAANAAAAMVGGKVALPSTPSTQPPRKETGMFKQLKAGLNKPSAGALGGAFGPAGQQKKSHLPHGGPKQVGRNQTFGADAARTGVPRRTPG